MTLKTATQEQPNLLDRDIEDIAAASKDRRSSLAEHKIGLVEGRMKAIAASKERDTFREEFQELTQRRTVLKQADTYLKEGKTIGTDEQYWRGKRRSLDRKFGTHTGQVEGPKEPTVKDYAIGEVTGAAKEILGAGEAVVGEASGMAEFIFGGLYSGVKGLASGVRGGTTTPDLDMTTSGFDVLPDEPGFDVKKVTKVIQTAQEDYHSTFGFVPRTEAGKRWHEYSRKVQERVLEGAATAGEFVQKGAEPTYGRNIAAAVGTITQMGLELAAFGIVFRGGKRIRSIKKKLSNVDPIKRKLTRKEAFEFENFLVESGIRHNARNLHNADVLNALRRNGKASPEADAYVKVLSGEERAVVAKKILRGERADGATGSALAIREKTVEGGVIDIPAGPKDPIPLTAGQKALQRGKKEVKGEGFEVVTPTKKRVRKGTRYYEKKGGKLVDITDRVKNKDIVPAFDLTTTGMPTFNELMENPDYFRDAKDMVGEVVTMSPDKYLTKAAEVLGVTPEESNFAIDPKRVKKYADAMRKGAKFPIAVLEYGKGNQEGRHRALAAKEVGIDIPVLEVRKPVERRKVFRREHPEEEQRDSSLFRESIENRRAGRRQGDIKEEITAVRTEAKKIDKKLTASQPGGPSPHVISSFKAGSIEGIPIHAGKTPRQKGIKRIVEDTEIEYLGERGEKGSISILFNPPGSSPASGFTFSIPKKKFTKKNILKAIADKVKQILGDEGGWIRNPFYKKGTPRKQRKNVYPKAKGKFEQVMQKARKATQDIEPTPNTKIFWKRKFEAMEKALINVSGPLDRSLYRFGREGDAVILRHKVIAGSTTKGMTELETLLPQVYGGMNKHAVNLLDAYLRNLRLSERYVGRGLKTPEGVDGEDLALWVDQIPSETKEILDARVEIFAKHMRKMLDESLAEGLISKGDHTNLTQFKHYLPTRYLDAIDPEISTKIGPKGRIISVRGSGLEFIKEGSESLFDTNSQRLLEQATLSHYTYIARNRANKAARDFADTAPEDNGIFKRNKVVAPAHKNAKTGKYVPTKWAAPPKGWKKIAYREGGETYELLIADEFYNQWLTSDPIFSKTFAKWLRALSGTSVLKAFATGINPEFALTNFPRDIALVWASDYRANYSTALPVYLGQIGKDLAAVMGDAWMKKGRYKQYIDELGGMEFVTHQGRLISPTHVKLHKSLVRLQQVLGKLGEFSEISVRLALRERVIRNRIAEEKPKTREDMIRIQEEATAIARTYLDFSQGGSYIKAADNVFPYINASTQAIRAIAGSASKEKARFAWKMAQVGALATGLYLANQYMYPGMLDEVSETDKNNNWIFPTGHKFKARDGTTRWGYFKIAKDQGQRLFATVAESLAAVSRGDKVDPKRITTSAKEFLNLEPSGVLPPTVKAYLAYAHNLDVWKSERVWKRVGEVDAYVESHKYTHPFWVALGEKTGLSPERSRAVAQQYFTSGNLYTSAAGHSYNIISDIMGKDPSYNRQRLTTEEKIYQAPFIRRLIRYTDPYYKFGESLGEYAIEANTEKVLLDRGLDSLVDDMELGLAGMKDINKYIQAAPQEERARLHARRRRLEKIQGIPEKHFWVELSFIKSSKGRARAFYARWLQESPDQRKESERLGRKVPGIISPKFIRELRRLKREGSDGSVSDSEVRE